MLDRFWLPAVAFAVLAASCAPDPFQAEYAAAKQGTDSQKTLQALLALDQRYPDRLTVKVDLGEAVLSRGGLDEALIYLSRGEALTVWPQEPASRTRLWTDLAACLWQKGDGPKAIVYANRALEDKNENGGAVFIRAKARLLAGERKAALADFDRGWETQRKSMRPQDFVLYSRALIDDKQDEKALSVLREYRNTESYDLGTGLVESGCYENLGLFDESVLAAYLDVNFQQSHGLMASSKVLENVRILESRIKARTQAPEAAGLTALEAVKAWLLGDWNKVVFDEALLNRCPDAKFLGLGALLESGRATDAELKAYSALEPRFHDFPAYYLPLLHYLKNVSKDVRNSGFTAVAEKVVNLAPQGPAASEGRQALALAYGVPPDSSACLLTRAEVDRALNAGDLAAIVRLWGTADNPSALYAVERLRLLAADAGVRSALARLVPATSGRAKERLNLVLQGR